MAMPDIKFASGNQTTKTVRLIPVTQAVPKKSSFHSIPEEVCVSALESEAQLPISQEVTSILCPVCNMHIEPSSFARHQNLSGCFQVIENKRRVESSKTIHSALRLHQEKVAAERHKTSLEERKIKRDFYTKHFGNSISTRRRALSAGCVPLAAQDSFRIGGTQLGSSFSRSGGSFRVAPGVSDLTKFSRSMRTTSTHTCTNCSTNFLSQTTTPTHGMRPKSSVVPCYHCPNWERVKSGLQGQL